LFGYFDEIPDAVAYPLSLTNFAVVDVPVAVSVNGGFPKPQLLDHSRDGPWPCGFSSTALRDSCAS